MSSCSTLFGASLSAEFVNRGAGLWLCSAAPSGRPHRVPELLPRPACLGSGNRSRRPRRDPSASVSTHPDGGGWFDGVDSQPRRATTGSRGPCRRELLSGPELRPVKTSWYTPVRRWFMLKEAGCWLGVGFGQDGRRCWRFVCWQRSLLLWGRRPGGMSRRLARLVVMTRWPRRGFVWIRDWPRGAGLRIWVLLGLPRWRRG